MSSIIEGDVLEVLRSLPREPSFDCVIADPPYNHGIWRNEPVAMTTRPGARSGCWSAWRACVRADYSTAMAGLNIWRTSPSGLT